MENGVEDYGSKGVPTVGIVIAVIIVAMIIAVGIAIINGVRANAPIYTDGWQVLVYENGSLIGNVKTLAEPSFERDKNGCYAFGKGRYCGSVTLVIEPTRVCTDRCS